MTVPGEHSLWWSAAGCRSSTTGCRWSLVSQGELYCLSRCEVRGGTWGELLSCPDIHTGQGHLLEGVCESGSNYACNGHASEVECCQGHYQGQTVGSTGQCSWMFTGGFGSILGTPLEKKYWKEIQWKLLANYFDSTHCLMFRVRQEWRGGDGPLLYRRRRRRSWRLSGWKRSWDLLLWDWCSSIIETKSHVRNVSSKILVSSIIF